MRNKIRFAGLLLLGGFLMVSCSLPTFLRSLQEELFEQEPPSQSSTLQVFPEETNAPEEQTTSPENVIQVIDQTTFEESETPLYVIEGRWPNLKGPEADVAAFNGESDGIVQAVQKDFLEAVNESAVEPESQGQAPISTLQFDYDMTYSDQRLFSFLLTFDQYIAISAHPFPFSHALNYDVDHAAFLRLDDLFLPGTDAIQEIGSYVDPILEGRDFGYEEGRAAEVMEQRENWNLLPEGLQINFDVYEVAPYAAGPQHIIIPWEDLAGMLDPAGPAARFIE